MVDADKRGDVFAVVLAAGTASRFGRSKQLQIIDGSTLVGRAMSTAHDVCGNRALLVVGHDRGRIVDAAGGLGFVVVNENYEDGIGGSIAAATIAVAHVADALLLTLADQPLVPATHLEALVDEWSGAEYEIVATSFADVLGPPVLFPRGAFTRLSKMTGEVGARSLLGDTAFDVKKVHFADAEIDIDTPDDLRRL